MLRSPMHNPPNVFVLETPDAPDLAFEADTATQATALSRAPWFLDAVERFLAGTGQCTVVFDAQCIRAATPAEAAIYGKLREEFDGPTRQFLIADLSGFTERSAARSAETHV